MLVPMPMHQSVLPAVIPVAVWAVVNISTPFGISAVFASVKTSSPVPLRLVLLPASQRPPLMKRRVATRSVLVGASTTPNVQPSESNESRSQRASEVSALIVRRSRQASLRYDLFQFMVEVIVSPSVWVRATALKRELLLANPNPNARFDCTESAAATSASRQNRASGWKPTPVTASVAPVLSIVQFRTLASVMSVPPIAR